MKISENTILYFSEKYETFSASVGGKDKEGNKYNCYIPVLITDKEDKNALIKRLANHDSKACKINIKEGFIGCFKNKKDEVLPQLVIQKFDVEDYYKGK